MTSGVDVDVGVGMGVLVGVLRGVRVIVGTVDGVGVGEAVRTCVGEGTASMPTVSAKADVSSIRNNVMMSIVSSIWNETLDVIVNT
jgi:hypothetical protein